MQRHVPWTPSADPSLTLVWPGAARGKEQHPALPHSPQRCLSEPHVLSMRPGPSRFPGQALGQGALIPAPACGGLGTLVSTVLHASAVLSILTLPAVEVVTISPTRTRGR